MMTIVKNVETLVVILRSQCYYGEVSITCQHGILNEKLTLAETLSDTWLSIVGGACSGVGFGDDLGGAASM